MSSILQDLKIFFHSLARFKLPKFQFLKHVKFAIFPKAKLTYWLADEEVVVYITNFKKKDRFSLAYKEIETGRIVIVNSGNPINYRLEQLKPGDQIEHTQVEQNQKY
jgi:hypothetical protein